MTDLSIEQQVATNPVQQIDGPPVVREFGKPMTDRPSHAVDGIAQASSRIEWIDYAKGICIFLVVMLHTTWYIENDRGSLAGWMRPIIEFARPFRMPDFFLISGLLLGRVIDRPWRRYLDTKVVHFFYFYVIWETILFLFFNVRESWDRDWERADQLLPRYLLDMVDPTYPLWFIHSLPIYFVITRLIKNLRPWIVLGVLTILHSLVATSEFEWLEKSWVVNQFCVRYIYFYSGYLLASRVFEAASWAAENRRGALLCIGVWIVLNQWAVTPVDFAALPLVSIILGFAGALAVIFCASLMATVPNMQWLRYIGKNSIVIFLSFLIPVAIMNRLLSDVITDIGTACLIVTVASIVCSVAVHRIVASTPLKFLYVRPKWANVDDSLKSTKP